jgi:PhnB protein
MPHRIPDRYRNAVIPHVMVDGAAAAIAFYAEAFGAEELFRIAQPDGRILHAEIRIGDSLVMVGDADPPFGAPSGSSATTVGLHVYVEDVDGRVARAVEAGANLLQPVQDMFYGDRAGMLQDPYGHVWVFLTHQEELSTGEIQQRGEALLAGSPG